MSWSPTVCERRNSFDAGEVPSETEVANGVSISSTASLVPKTLISSNLIGKQVLWFSGYMNNHGPLPSTVRAPFPPACQQHRSVGAALVRIPCFCGRQVFCSLAVVAAPPQHRQRRWPSPSLDLPHAVAKRCARKNRRKRCAQKKKKTRLCTENMTCSSHLTGRSDHSPHKPACPACSPASCIAGSHKSSSIRGSRK